MIPVEPSFVPTLAIGGEALPPEWASSLESVRVQQRLSEPTLCELTFTDPADELIESSRLRPGSALSLRVTGSGTPLFDGDLTAMELTYLPSRGRELHVRGYDRLHRLRKRQRVSSHVQVTFVDIVRELVAELGLRVQATERGPLRPLVVQENESDLAFLANESASCGLYLTLRGDVLHVITLEGLGDPVSLALGDSLFEARFEMNADPACRSVSVSGWDPGLTEPHEGRAANARVGRTASGAAPPDAYGLPGELVLVGEPMPDRAHATARAQAELDRRVAGEVTFTGTASGDPRLQPGVRVQLGGVVAPFAGRFVLSAVTHVFDARVGFVSEMSSAPPSRPPRRRGAVVTYGVVTRVGDPEGLARIRTSLPAYGEVETGWMQVVAPGAGPHKGLVATPDVGDRVLVLLAQGDPARGVVLGGLFGSTAPPDSGVEGNGVGRVTWHTSTGHVVRLDDGEGVVSVRNAAGSYVELSRRAVRVHAVGGLTIEAPGQPIVIRGASIDFERG